MLSRDAWYVFPYEKEKNCFLRGMNSPIGLENSNILMRWPWVLAGAILDRLLHSATVLNIQGRSYRLKELGDQLCNQASTTTATAQENEKREN